ncbi:MAG TPA: hypothetical protein VK824_00680, partial [Planctomycetota bacterium]|nr:hypothetical protein [Planctomycetota bacterium]
MPQLEYIAASDGLRLRTLRAAASAAPALSALLGFAAALVLAVLCAAHVARGRAWLWISALGLALATGAGLLAGLAGGLSPTWIALLCADWFGTVDNMLGPVNYVELNGAFAGAALPLALLGLLAGARRAHGARVCPRRGVAADEPAAADPAAGAVIAAGILALVGTLALYRAPGLTDVLGLLPGLRLAENTRLSLLALLGIAVLAGFGLDAIGRAPRVPRLRLRFALLLGALLLGAWGALAYAVHGGRIVLDDGRQRDDGIVLHALPVDEACALLHPSLAARAAAGMSFDAEPHRVFAGWFASPPGTAPPRLPGTAADTADGGAAASAPVARAIGGRLIYSRAGRSVEALVTSALRRGDPATPWLGARGAPLCVFVAAVPERELPPGSPPVRLRLSFDDGRVLFTSPSSAPDAGATPLPFP